MSKLAAFTSDSVHETSSVQCGRCIKGSQKLCPEFLRQGRTQWDAMAEVTRDGRFRATRLVSRGVSSLTV